MTDLRSRLADALQKHLICDCGEWAEDMGESCGHLADVLLSLPGIAIVELPEPDPLATVNLSGQSPEYFRALAAALLASANAAETKT